MVSYKKHVSTDFIGLGPPAGNGVLGGKCSPARAINDGVINGGVINSLPGDVCNAKTRILALGGFNS